MPKVFRIHDTGPTHEDWFVSHQIGAKVIETIKVLDSAGKKQPTSIPSPFARIDLVRTAFETVASPDNSGRIDLDKFSDAHKLVSDALDIGQILFNLQRHNEQLSVSRWNKELEIARLVNSNDKGHQRLGKTLDLFLKQDADQYNFDQMDDLFILKYNHKVIGGTSPSTLFFAAARADEMEVDIQFGNDVMLDPRILPLYKREEDYVRYLFSMRKSNSEFATRFREVTVYLEASINALENHNPSLYNKIQSDNGEFYESLQDQNLPDDIGVPIKILNNLQVKEAGISKFESDFEIESTKYDGIAPLILPSTTFSKDWQYTSAQWNQSIEVPQNPSIPLNERKLPGVGHAYPFLSESDFLANTIIKLPYNINSEKFECFGASNFLLPIKPLFFEFFNAEDIGSSVKLEIEEKSAFGNLVTVSLSIPTVKGYIDYKKTYKPAETGSPFTSDGEGKVITAHINLAITPFVKSHSFELEYAIGLLNTDEQFQNVRISPKDSHSTNPSGIDTTYQRRSNLSSGFVRITDYYNFRNKFDIVELQVGDEQCILIPKLKSHNNGAKQFRFALDFGTTNTHIEYTFNDSPIAFDFEELDSQIVYLNDFRKIATKNLTVDQQFISSGLVVMSQELIPNEIQKGKHHQFPIRTCLLENQVIDHQTSVRLFNDLNIGFDFEKRFINDHLHYVTELKWSDVKEVKNRIRIKNYFIELLTLCKNKVLLNDGDLSQTQFNWFYPVSMIGHQLAIMRTVWKEAFEYVFVDTGLTPEKNLIEHSESIAPFYYYHKKKGIAAFMAPALSIDIGGGTTDLVAFENGEPSLISSFQFAGNAIFGDGLNKDQALNGFLQKFSTKFAELIGNPKNKLASANEVYHQLKKKGNNSTDLINYFFSLESNPEIVKNNLPISLSGDLNQDQDFKILFIVFYTALFYHIAQILKAKNIKAPSTILFSGNGSRTIFNLNSGDKSNWGATEKLINSVFNEIFQVNHSNVSIEIDESPKEVTTKGGLFVSEGNSNLEKIVCTHLGGLTKLGAHNIFDSNESHIAYEDMSDELYADVESNIEEYFTMLDRINKKISFSKEFGVSPNGINALEEIKSNNHVIQDYIRLGLKQRESLANSSKEPIEETLFFYAFVGILNDLAYKVSISQ